MSSTLLCSTSTSAAIIHLLLDHKFKPWEPSVTRNRGRDGRGLSSLRKAILLGREELACNVLNTGAYPLSVDSDFRTLLMSAIKKGSTQLVKALLDRGASLGHSNRWVQTALHLAVNNRDEATIRFLLSKGADPTTADIDGASSLFYSFGRRDPARAAIILARQRQTIRQRVSWPLFPEAAKGALDYPDKNEGHGVREWRRAAPFAKRTHASTILGGPITTLLSIPRKPQAGGDENVTLMSASIMSVYQGSGLSNDLRAHSSGAESPIMQYWLGRYSTRRMDQDILLDSEIEDLKRQKSRAARSKNEIPNRDVRSEVGSWTPKQLRLISRQLKVIKQERCINCLSISNSQSSVSSQSRAFLSQDLIIS
jgi:hypothetical protein